MGEAGGGVTYTKIVGGEIDMNSTGFARYIRDLETMYSRSGRYDSVLDSWNYSARKQDSPSDSWDDIWEDTVKYNYTKFFAGCDWGINFGKTSFVPVEYKTNADLGRFEANESGISMLLGGMSDEK